MTPIVFEGCFGWLHEAAGDTGVVLCNPYGHEALWVHRSWRGLAENLAASGIPSLRFDYLGTGDSDESEDDGERIEAWVSSIVNAVRCLRRTTGVHRVVLCGVRLGGLLASLAAQRLGDVDGLILMAPVETGKSYLRELKLIHRRWRNTSAPHIAAETITNGAIETLGYRLNAETAARLEASSLLSGEIVVNVPQVLILDPVKITASDKLRDCLALTGSQVEVGEFPDYAHLMSESIASPAPSATYQRVSDWVNQSVNSFASELVSKSTSESVLNRTRKTADAVAPIAAEASPSMSGDGFIEMPVIFGDGRLFGVYCQPAPFASPLAQSETQAAFMEARCTASGQQAVLFPNTARSHHVGEARMWVTQARRLAKLGIASLRMDVGLLGDSKHAAVSVSVADLHSPQSVKDVNAGIDWLLAAGHARPTAVGICSGAYLAFHAAVAHQAIASVILINQREYFWAEGREQALGIVVASTSVYMQSLGSIEKWKRLLAGETPVRAIVGSLLKRRVKQWKEKAAYLIGNIAGVESATRIVRKQFEVLNQRGVDVRIIYGDFDEGLELNAAFLGKDFSWIAKLPNVTAVTDGSMDHALFLYPARASMTRVLEQQLLGQMVVPRTLDRVATAKASSTTPQSHLGNALSVLTGNGEAGAGARAAGEIA